MNRFIAILAIFMQAIAFTGAFAPSPRLAVQTRVFAEDDSSLPDLPNFAERGVSIDQDGKSNVWAIEPKMEVSTKSSEESMSSALVAGGGLAVFAVVAGLVLTNLPDPNQF